MNPTSHLRWTASIAGAWTAAGGVAGGTFIAVSVLAGQIHPDALFILAGGMAALGAVLGSVHGAVLGQLSHRTDSARASTFGDGVLLVLYVVAAFVAAVMLSLWLAVSATLARTGSLFGVAAFGCAALLAGVVLIWATFLGWRAFENAYMHWPDHRLGGRLVLGAFALLSSLFLTLRPAIPGTQLRMPALVLLGVAALATLWLATPAVIMALRLTHRSQRAHAALAHNTPRSVEKKTPSR